MAPHTSSRFVSVMDKAAAIVTDVGSATGHMAILAREFRVPTLVDTREATQVLESGQVVTVDSFNARVYAGRVEPLLKELPKENSPFFEYAGLRTAAGNYPTYRPLESGRSQTGKFQPPFLPDLS